PPAVCHRRWRSAYVMYLVAQAYELRGDSRRAEEIATKALAQAPASAQRHFQLAGQLQQQGLSKWAEREYRAAIGDGSDFQYAWDARWQLSTLLADQERFGEEADVLDKLVEQLKDQRAAIQAAQRNLNRGIFDRIEARAHFYRAKQLGAEKNEAKQVEHLKQAIELYPSDPDLLIALYRTNQSDDE